MKAEELVLGEEYVGYSGSRDDRRRDVERTGRAVGKLGELVLLKNELGACGYVWLDSLRPVSPAAEKPIAEGDRLFGGNGCCLCGATQWAPNEPFDFEGAGRLGPGRANQGMRICRSCAGPCWANANASDAEITRRRSLLSGSAGSVDAAHRETAGSAPSGPGPETSTQPVEPERSPADLAAWKLHEETLAAEERKRRHLEERRAAYASVKALEAVSAKKTENINFWFFSQFATLDAARAKAEKDDAPAYVNLNWPPADENDP